MSQSEIQQTYAQNIQRIKDLIDKISSPDCDIDKMLDYVSEATSLLKICNQKLVTTGAQIEDALKVLDEIKAQKS